MCVRPLGPRRLSARQRLALARVNFPVSDDLIEMVAELLSWRLTSTRYRAIVARQDSVALVDLATKPMAGAPWRQEAEPAKYHHGLLNG